MCIGADFKHIQSQVKLVVCYFLVFRRLYEVTYVYVNGNQEVWKKYTD